MEYKGVDWKVAEQDGFDTIIRDNINVEIARVGWTGNANLIAAAPDMYEALKEAGVWLENVMRVNSKMRLSMSGQHLQNSLNKALAKVEGR